MSQVSEEIVAVEDQCDEARQASEDDSEHRASSYISLIQDEMVEMTPVDRNYAKVDGPDAQSHNYEKFLEEMRRLIKRGSRLLVVLLVVLLLLLLVFGITSVTLMSHLASAEESKAAKTNIASTEAPYTQRSLTYLASTDLGSNCNSAFYKPDGNILVGTNDGIKLISRRNLAVTSYNTSFKLVTSFVEHHNVNYLLHRAGNVTKVELCLPEMNNCQTLLEFNNTSRYGSTMAVSSRYITVRNPDGDKLIIYDFISQQKKIKQPAQFHYLFFLPDGHLLVGNKSTLTKYRLEDGELIKLWTCDGLTNLGAMVADTNGFIYGLTHREKLVYVISPDGELLQTIDNDNLPFGYIGQASISENEIAVPGVYDKKLHIFKINN